MKEVYQADDGTLFDHREDARVHDRKLMEAWLNDSVVGSWVREVLETMDDADDAVYFGTYRDMGKCFRDAAYQVYLAKKAKYEDPAEFKKFIDRLLDLDEEEIDTNECCIRSEN